MFRTNGSGGVNAENSLGFNLRRSLLSATSLATTLLFLVPGIADAQSTTRDWSGPFVGATVGGTFGGGSIDLSYSDSSNSPPTIGVPMLGPSGSIVGGYNFQRGNFVYGLAADGSVLVATGQASGSNYSANERLYGLLSLRGRLGWDGGAFLPYLTAGIAFANAHVESSGGFNVAESNTHVGWTVGAGVEFAATENFSIDLLYRYTDYGTQDYDVGVALGEVGFTTHQVQAGLNWRF